MGRPEMSVKEAYERFTHALINDEDVRMYIEKYGTDIIPELNGKFVNMRHYFAQIEGHAEWFMKRGSGEELLREAKHLNDVYNIELNFDDVFDKSVEIDDMHRNVENELEKIKAQKELLYSKCEHEYVQEHYYSKGDVLICKKCGKEIPIKETTV